MARKKTGQKNPRKSAKKDGISRIIFSRGILIFILVLIVAGLIFWFLPQITSWMQNTWHGITTLFGLGLALIILLFLIILGVCLSHKSYTFIKSWNRWTGGLILLVFIWGLISFVNTELGGTLGQGIITTFMPIQIVILVLLLLLSLLFFVPHTVWAALKGMSLAFGKLFTALFSTKTRPSKAIAKVEKAKHIITKTEPGPEVATAEEPEVIVREMLRQPTVTPGGWQLPPIDILDMVPEHQVTETDVEKRAELITEAMASYGVEAKIVQINVGPTVTQFGVEPGWDIKYKDVREKDKDGNVKIVQQEISRTRVKVERISSLANDLALALAASSIRIEAPVPGKSIVGIEVPNLTFGSVNLRSIIESSAFQKIVAKSKLAMPLGKGAGGETAAADLAKMPHLLIAGATGSGKTVFINSIICSFLFYNTPDDIKFIMIDPKRVELVNYNDIPQLITPVVVDTEKAVIALRWLVNEMDQRYKRFAQAGARNIDSYNKNLPPGQAMPFIILVIDELADLMMTAFGEVEQNLCRLAQLSRATGIHLIVATQRPSVDVITGLIKANFPTRISFSLTSQIDSRTILDTPGAEKLLGRGDMLFMPTDASKPKRLQGPFLTDPEIERIVDFWKQQKRLESQHINFEEMEHKASLSQDEDEVIMEEARKLAAEHTAISTSFLQRKLRIGYPRAARIMEKLKEEQAGQQ
jgi:S-DNA-T family DNA segregation ATPase FtsK/SpoIIIE